MKYEGKMNYMTVSYVFRQMPGGCFHSKQNYDPPMVTSETIQIFSVKS
jgi:hypothetical protein